jgi:hypothetical protein
MLDLHHCGDLRLHTPLDRRRPQRRRSHTRLMDPAVVTGTRMQRVDGAAGIWAELTD